MEMLSFKTDQGSNIRMLLAKQQLLNLRNAFGTAIECVHGSVWVTFERDGYDHFLKPGERLRIPASGRALVQALEESDLKFVNAASDEKPSARSIEILSNSRPNLHVYPASCWRNSLTSAFAARVNLETPF